MPAPVRPSLLAARHWPSLFGVMIGWTVARWPRALQGMASRPLAWLMWRLMPARKRIAARNLELCFPQWDAATRAELLRANFRSQAMSVFEFLSAWWGRSTQDLPCRISGTQHVEAARDQGRGIILIAAHFHTLEIAVRLLARELRVAGIYRAHDSAWLEWAVWHGRARYTEDMIEREQMRPALRHLKRGGVLWFAPDQESRRGESVFVPFFGRTASALTSTHQLARASGAVVLPFFHHRDADGGYSLEILPPLPDFPSEDAQADTAGVMQAIEAIIRRAPEQYLWVHARFKRQPDGISVY